jgi:hypothetical protein
VLEVRLVETFLQNEIEGSLNMYEIDFLPVGDGARSGDAIALRYGNLEGTRAEQTVVVIDGGFTDDGRRSWS